MTGDLLFVVVVVGLIGLGAIIAWRNDAGLEHNGWSPQLAYDPTQRSTGNQCEIRFDAAARAERLDRGNELIDL